MLSYPGALSIQVRGHGVTVIGGMNFLVVAPEREEPDECNGSEVADVP
jgi:hypothetical protein